MSNFTIENATIIFNQLGGIPKLTAMIGLKIPLISREDSSISFRWKAKSSNKSNYIKVTLNCSDLYNMEFGRIHGNNYRVIKVINDVFAYNLIPFFESETSLYLSL